MKQRLIYIARRVLRYCIDFRIFPVQPLDKLLECIFVVSESTAKREIKIEPSHIAVCIKEISCSMAAFDAFPSRVGFPTGSIHQTIPPSSDACDFFRGGDSLG